MFGFAVDSVGPVEAASAAPAQASVVTTSSPLIVLLALPEGLNFISYSPNSKAAARHQWVLVAVLAAVLTALASCVCVPPSGSGEAVATILPSACARNAGTASMR